MSTVTQYTPEAIAKINAQLSENPDSDVNDIIANNELPTTTTEKKVKQSSAVVITDSARAAYNSEEEKDERILAIRDIEECSLSEATRIHNAIARQTKSSAPKKPCITDLMYSYLADAPRTEEELRSWIKENGTENTMRWFRAHDKVRQLANQLHAKGQS